MVRPLTKFEEDTFDIEDKQLGVQQCFGVVYHELTTLRWVYFARAALAAQAK